jgi:hypothetical protein
LQKLAWRWRATLAGESGAVTVDAAPAARCERANIQRVGAPGVAVGNPPSLSGVSHSGSPSRRRGTCQQATLERKSVGGWKANLEGLYKGLVDAWVLYDKSETVPLC